MTSTTVYRYRRGRLSESGNGDVNRVTRRGRQKQADEKRILKEVDSALEKGRELMDWWKDVHARNAYRKTTEVVQTYNKPYEGFAFFDKAIVDGRKLPVMGLVDQLLFDRPKGGEAQHFKQQIRQFALHYLLRISDFRKPDMFLKGDRPKSDTRVGFGYEQVFYKDLDGKVGRFSKARRDAIVDLCDFDKKYKWIVLKVNIFNFQFSAAPFADAGPKLSVPLDESSYLVIAPDFVTDEDKPSFEVDGRKCIGEYGFAYAFIRNPSPEFIAFGPGEFEAAWQTIRFRVLDDGRVLSYMAFVVNQPERIMNAELVPVDLGVKVADMMSLGMSSRIMKPLRDVYHRIPFTERTFDPLMTGIDLADFATGGRAKKFNISRDRVLRVVLLRHFIQHYEMITGALATWRQIPDWTKAANLPEWVTTGVSS